LLVLICIAFSTATLFLIGSLNVSMIGMPTP
jgi:hypothetical protein